MARSHFILTGVKVEYGTMKELLAIKALQFQRNAQYASAAVSIVGPKNEDGAMKILSNALFPESKVDDLKKVKRYRGMFEKLRKLNMFAFKG